MDCEAHVLRIKVLYICLLASTLLPLSDAINLGRAFNEGQKISRSTFIKSWQSLKSLNNYPTFKSLKFDLYGSSSSITLPPFHSLAPQGSLYPPTPTPTYSPVPIPTHNNYGQPSSDVNVSPPKLYLQPPLPPPPPPPSPVQHKRPENGVWCVAKPTVPDPIVQEAMDYACGSGADCKLVQPNGSCYQPNTLLAHASYAFNSYWQKTKSVGGTCDFGGTAMLVTVDPSYNKCNYKLA